MLNSVSLRHSLAVVIDSRRWLEQLNWSYCDKPAGQYLSARSQQQLHRACAGSRSEGGSIDAVSAAGEAQVFKQTGCDIL